MSAVLPQRVLMTADAVGGVWTYAVELARELSGLGVDTALAVMGTPPDASQRREAGAIPNLALFEAPYALEWMDDPWTDVDRAGDWLLTIEERVRPDVVHLNGYAHGSLPWRAPRLVVGHSCVLSWWRAVLGEDAPPRFDRYRTAVRDGLHAADVVVAPTRAMLDALEHHYGPLPDGRVIPNGTCLPRWRRGPKEPFVLAAGRLWDKAKNLSTLQQIAGRVPWPIRVAGDEIGPGGWRRRQLDDVERLGRLPRRALAAWMRRAAVFAHPARYEPFGLAPLEAAASGCALVLGDIDTLREVWSDAALYVDPSDPDALAESLHLLVGDPELRTDLARRASSRASRYGAAAQARAYLALYAGLLCTRRAARVVGPGSPVAEPEMS